MTKQLHPASLPAAVAKIYGALSPKGAGAAINKSAQTVYGWANEDTDFWPNVPQAIALDRAYLLAGHGPAPIYRHYGLVLASLEAPAHSPADPLDRVDSTLKEALEAVQSYRAYCLQHPGEMSPARRVETLREIQEAIDELEGMARDIEAECPRAEGDNLTEINVGRRTGR